MLSFIDFIDQFRILQNLKKRYLGDNNSLKDIEILDKLIVYLSNIDIKVSKNLDLIASFYQNYVNHIDRKPLGEFYTPIKIVNHILDGIGYSVDSKVIKKTIIDISCGSGSFLIQCIKRIIAFEFRRLQVENISDLNSEDALNLINTIHSLIYGIDINPIACILCQINIFYTTFDIIQKFLFAEPNYQIPLFHIMNQNTLELSVDQEYDFVVGNPPYIFIRDISKEQKELIEGRDFKTNKGQYDYYQLFLELGINLLKQGGFLGYIIPDSILALSNRKILRKFIHDNSLIKEISIVGSQFEDPTVANVILILEKSNDKAKRASNLININFVAVKEDKSNTIRQSMIEKWDYNFLINLNPTDVKIINYLKTSFPTLKTLLKEKRFKIIISRGVELTKKGEAIYCNNCMKYLPLPKNKLICPRCGKELNKKDIDNIVVKTIPDNSHDEFAPFISSINRYKVNKAQYINLNKPGITYKDPEIYTQRIIIRQLNENNLICATYDDFSYTSQSFYNLKVIQSPIEEFNNFYLLGLINSELLSYYFIKSFGSYKSLFSRILIEKIKSLPILIPNNYDERNSANMIKNEVNNLLKSYQNGDKPLNAPETRLNTLVYDLYQINHDNRTYITSFIKNL